MKGERTTYKVKGEGFRVKGFFILLFLSIFSFQFSICQAQPRLRNAEYSIGVHGGVSASTILFRPSVGNMTPITNACVLGGNGGLVFRYAEHKYCGLQVELNYLHRGWAEKNTSTGEAYSRSLHYVEVPLMMHLNFGSPHWRWFFNLGPQLGYCVKDEGNSGVLVNGSGAAEYDPIEQPFDWGLIAGTGVYCKTKKAGTYQLEIRFDFSFGGIFRTRPIDYFDMASPMDLSINFAYMWNFKKKNKYEDQLRSALRGSSAGRKEL